MSNVLMHQEAVDEAVEEDVAGAEEEVDVVEEESRAECRTIPCDGKYHNKCIK